MLNDQKQSSHTHRTKIILLNNKQLFKKELQAVQHYMSLFYCIISKLSF